MGQEAKKEKKKTMDNLMLITDTGLFPDSSSFLEAIEKTLAGGVRLIQLREKSMSGRELLNLARRLREITRKHKARLIINERVDIAKLVEADGLHLPVQAFSVKDARTLLGAEALIGASTHSLAEAQRAEADGADYITFGPVYQTASKACYGEPLGLGPLKETASLLSIPVYALGGITSGRVREVLKTGAAGVALISAILKAKDITAETSGIINQLSLSGQNRQDTNSLAERDITF